MSRNKSEAKDCIKMRCHYHSRQPNWNQISDVLLMYLVDYQNKMEINIKRY